MKRILKKIWLFISIVTGLTIVSIYCFFWAIGKLISKWVIVTSLLFLLLFSCEKMERYDWKCDSMVIIYPPGQKCPDTIRNTVYHYQFTEEQMITYIKMESYTLRSVYEGDTTLIVSTVGNCGKFTCN